MKRFYGLLIVLLILTGCSFLLPKLVKIEPEQVAIVVNPKPKMSKVKFDKFDTTTQFLLVYNTKTKEYYGRQENVKPESLASLVKVLVAYLVVKDYESGNLKPTDSMNFEDWDSDGHDAVGNTTQEALHHMLYSSSNSATNLLIDKIGGFEVATQKLRKYGFNDSTIECFVDPSQVSMKCEGVNHSTLLDMTKAFEYLSTTDNEFTRLAQKPMRETIYNYSHTARIMNKGGINSLVIGNISLVEVDGDKYIISTIHSDPGSADQYDDFTEINEVRNNIDPNSKKDPISKITQEVVNELKNSRI